MIKIIKTGTKKENNNLPYKKPYPLWFHPSETLKTLKI